jgi:hypothetical protein
MRVRYQTTSISTTKTLPGIKTAVEGSLFKGRPSHSQFEAAMMHTFLTSRSLALRGAGLAAICLPALLLGCGVQQVKDASAPGAVAADPEAEAPAAEQPAKEAPDAPASQRKIIYTATVALVVEDFAETDRRIQSLAQEFGGFIAEFREDRTYGDRLAGRWVIRTPAARFSEFLEQITALGVPETKQIDAQDVTEEFVDLEARLTNKRKLEERILDLLENQTGEIEDVIAVETELARVREEIERMEGRLRYLKDRVDLTTITITAREEVDYVPPQAPTFTGKVAATWGRSLTAMRQAGEGVALAIVALTPWLVVLAVILAPVLIWWGRRRRKNIVAAEAVG